MFFKIHIYIYIYIYIHISSPCWYLVGGEEACVSQGLWELYRRGLEPLAGLTKPGRSQGRDQTKPSTWSSRLGVGRGANNPTL